METNIDEQKNQRFPYSGQLEVEIYFREYKDNCANDCRRYLHKSQSGRTPIIQELTRRLGNESESFTIFPKDYALLRHVPLGIDVEKESGSRRSGAGKARGGLEIYDVTGFNENVLKALREVLKEKKLEASNKSTPWFSYYRIYIREEIR